LLAACLIRQLEANDAVVVAPQILDLRTTVRVNKKKNTRYEQISIGRQM
jgi:hypothetical protein